MEKAKKVFVGAGIIVVWAGGMLLAWKTGEIIGSKIGSLCSRATNKLLEL